MRLDLKIVAPVLESALCATLSVSGGSDPKDHLFGVSRVCSLSVRVRKACSCHHLFILSSRAIILPRTKPVPTNNRCLIPLGSVGEIGVLFSVDGVLVLIFGNEGRLIRFQRRERKRQPQSEREKSHRRKGGTPKDITQKGSFSPRHILPLHRRWVGAIGAALCNATLATLRTVYCFHVLNTLAGLEVAWGVHVFRPAVGIAGLGWQSTIVERQ